MEQLLLHLLFPVLIGFFLAVMDRVNEPVAFRASVFRNLNPKWWVRSISWQYVKFIRFTKYRPDAWHLAKTMMIMCIPMIAVFEFKYTGLLLVNAIIDMCIITGSFVLFYDYILKRK